MAIKTLIAQRTRRMDTKDALMTIAIAASKADGVMHEPELAHLRTLVFLHPRLFSEVESVDIYIDIWRRFVESMGTEKAVRLAAARLTPRLRETAYAWAVDIVYADHKKKQSEQTFLRRLWTTLGINGTLAGKVKAVTAIQNRVA